MKRSSPVLTPTQEERFRQSDENCRNEAWMIAEMEAGGLKVVRRDDMYCRAVLITPETVHLATQGMHRYFPNAVAELYEQWKTGKAA